MKLGLIILGIIFISAVLLVTFALMNAASRLDRLEESGTEIKEKEN